MEDQVTSKETDGDEAVVQQTAETKFCKHCGSKIDKDCVICPKCGKQVEDLKQAQAPIVINNTNTNTNTNINRNVNASVGHPAREKNKWVAVLLCLFLGVIGAHKFYEGKIALGVIYIFTMGLFGIGVLVDLISLLLKPNPYYV